MKCKFCDGGGKDYWGFNGVPYPCPVCNGTGEIKDEPHKKVEQTNEEMKPFKLCYVRHRILYFTDNFEKQWGDDWDDAPYEHNAGEPYEWEDDWTPEQNRKHGHAHIRYIVYVNGYGICEPKRNRPYSVEAINKGAVPWLYHETAGGLYAGATMEEAGKWLTVAGARCGEMQIANGEVES